jgi:hypothetical protein
MGEDTPSSKLALGFLTLDGIDAGGDDHVIIAHITAAPVIHGLGIVPMQDGESLVAIVHGKMALANRANQGLVHSS